MSNEIPLDESGENGARKRRYVPPQLVRYGRVRDLTQGGTAGTQEFFKCAGFADKRRRCNPSDQRAKENIVRVGDHPLGIGLYLFHYKPGFRDQWGHGRQFGVMAQEVEAVVPEAVSMHPDGYRMVDYAMLGISRAVHA
jgi:hypothetical protein